MHVTSTDPTVEGLFSAPHQYVIPKYQRAYAWDTEQVDQLWSDITSHDGEHFLGPMVVYDPGKETAREVIDGQQRLTTLQIILAIVRDEYRRIVLETMTPFAVDPGTGVEFLVQQPAYPTPRLRLRTGDRNRRVLEDYILRSPADPQRRWLTDPAQVQQLSRPDRAQNRPLIEAWLRVRAELEALLAKPGVSRLDALRAFEENLVRRVRLVVLDVSNLDDAYLLFETLNDRGLKLSAADLLKSHLLSRIDQQAHDSDDLSQASTTWDSMVDELGGGDITGFLRHYLLAKHTKVTKAAVFPQFKIEVKTKPPAKVLEDLRAASVVYSELVRPTQTEGTEVFEVLTDLLGTGVDSHRVALLPARRWLPIARFTKFARLVETLSFRWKITGGNAQELESVYQKAAAAIVQHEGAKIDEIEASLKARMPADDLFRTAFSQQSLGYLYVASYALRRIERFVHPGELTIKPGGQVHVEHLMPQTMNEYWQSKVGPEESYEVVVQRWGNLTLLLPRLNQQISNGPWETKRFGADPSRPGGLNASQIQMTRDLAQVPQWTSAEIELRSQWLGAVAVKVWGSGAPGTIPTFSAVHSSPSLIGTI